VLADHLLHQGVLHPAEIVQGDLAALKEDELLEARVRATITDGVIRFSEGLQ